MKAVRSSIEISERDMAILRGLLESRVMTLPHLAAIHFDGRPEATKKRLQKLKAAGYVGERRSRVNQPGILFLTRQGHGLLHAEGVLSDFPPLSSAALERRSRVSEQTLRHELEVMDVKAAFHGAARTSGKFVIAEFNTWPALYQFTARRPGRGGGETLVKPDAFIQIHETESDGGVSEHSPFFLEVDRSSETLGRLISQAHCYLDYYNSGGFAVRNGEIREKFKEHPFRVLVICKSAERRNNIAERLLQGTPPILTQVLLSTLAETAADPFGPIWIRPLDYRDSTKGTCYDVDKIRYSFAYRRQAERDDFVTAKLSRICLL